jgi:hypothetical protein
MVVPETNQRHRINALTVIMVDNDPQPERGLSLPPGTRARGISQWQWPRVPAASLTGVAEQVVHRLCAGGDDGAQFLPVDHFRGAGTGVADQAGDLLGADALVAH